MMSPEREAEVRALEVQCTGHPETDVIGLCLRDALAEIDELRKRARVVVVEYYDPKDGGADLGEWPAMDLLAEAIPLVDRRAPAGITSTSTLIEAVCAVPR